MMSLSQRYQTINTPLATEFRSDHVGAVNCLAVEQQHNRYMLSGGADSSLKVWDLGEDHLDDYAIAGEDDNNTVTRQGRKKKIQPTAEGIIPRKFAKIAEAPRKKFHQYGISSVQWLAQDAGLFITSSFDHYVKAWDSEVLETVYDFDLGYRVYSTDISGTGQHGLVATATDHPLIVLLDLRTTSKTHTLKGHSVGSVQSVKWSPTEPHLLASGGSDGTVRLWDVRQSRACVDVLDMHRTQPQGNKRRRSSGRRTSGTGTGTNSKSVSFNAKVVAHMGTVNGLLWLRNGRHLISAGTDDSMRLWSLPRYSREVGTQETDETRGVNTLVNYGRFVSDRYPQTLYMCLNSESGLNTDDLQEDQPSLFFYPSDTGEVLIFEAFTGVLVSRNIRPVIPGVAQYGTIPRTTCIVSRRCASSDCNTLDQKKVPVEYFSGAMDGTITRWVIPADGFNSGSDYQDDSQSWASSNEQGLGDVEHSDSEDSDSEDYETAGDILNQI